MLRRLGKKAQTTAEYAILIALVVGAVVAMQVYVRRGLQARVRDVVDDVDVGGQYSSVPGLNNIFTAGDQYEPYYNSSTATTAQTGTDQENLSTGGGVSRTSNQTTNATREQTLGW